MGLAERRAIKSFADNKFPELKADIDKAAGMTVEMEIDWETLAAEDYTDHYDEDLPKIYFKPLIFAFKEICRDEMGREAVAKKLKKVVVKSVSGSTDIHFKDGTLTIDLPFANVDYWEDRRALMIKVLERAL